MAFAFSMSWYVYTRTGSSLALGGSLTFLSLPELAAPALGTVVDRASKKVILAIAAGAGGIVPLLLIGALATTPRHVLSLYIAATVLGALEVLDWPAFQAVFPLMVPAPQLTKANSLWSAIEGMLMILGPAAGGYLVGQAMVRSLLMVSISYFLALAVLLIIRFEEPTTPRPHASWAAETRAGCTYVWKNPRIRRLLAISTVWNVVESAGTTFILVVLRRHLHLNATVTGMTFGLEGMGNLLGTVIFATVSKWVPRNTGTITGALLGCALFALWSWVVTIGQAVALILAMGVISTFYSLHIRTWRQEIIPHEIFGRVISTFRMTARSTTPFSPLLGSWAIAQVGLPLFYLGIGASGFITLAGLGWRFFQSPTPPDDRSLLNHPMM